MSLNIGDTRDRMNLWTRKSRVPAARIITSASSAQKLVDSGTVAVGSVVAMLGIQDDMTRGGEWMGICRKL